MKARFNALKAGADSGCFPLDKGGEDLVALFFLQAEEAGGGVLRNEFQGLEHTVVGSASRPGHRSRFTVKLVMVAVLGGSVLPDSAGEGLELLCVKLPWVSMHVRGVRRQRFCWLSQKRSKVASW